MGDTEPKTDSPLTLSDRVAEEVRALLARRRMSGRDLAKLLGTSPSWVSYRLTGTTEIGLTDLERIAAALEVEVTDLLPAPVSAERRSGSGGLIQTLAPADGRMRASSHLTAACTDHHPTGPDPNRGPVNADPSATTPAIPRSRRPIRLRAGVTR